MSDSESARASLRSLMQLHGDPAVAADDFMGSARTRKDLAELVRPLVELVARIEGRNIVRGVERRAFRSVSDADAEATADRNAARKQLLQEFVPLPDGRHVRWGEMTVEDHLARIDYLHKKLTGISETIDQHRAAIALIEAAGVSCLDEIEDAA